MKQRHLKPKSLGSVLDSVLKSSLKGNIVKLIEIERHWEKIVGAHLASVSRPAKIDKKSLTIWASDAVWVNSMLFLRPMIASKVNSILGRQEVEQVVIIQNSSVNQLLKHHEKKGEQENAPLTESEKSEMEKALLELPDSQLRSTFKRVILESVRNKGGR